MRATTAIAIDGALSEPAWSAAPALTTLTQYVPDEGRPSTEPVRIMVLYDDEALYVGAELHDSAPVTERLGRRDADLESDWFRVYVDAQHDGRTGAGFFVNPSNVQRDTLLFDDTSDNADWDALWTSSTRITATGWSVEMRIPLSQLRFPRREEQQWRVNFARQIFRRNELAYFAPIPRNETGFVSRFAELEGIRDLRLASSLDVRPYATWRGDRRAQSLSNFRERGDSELDGGLDLTWRPASNVTFTGALRPDFGQVEVDPAAINLTEYELFFAEKRPLFLENANLFAYGTSASNTVLNFNITPPQMFYSRRIGRQPQGTSLLGDSVVAAPLETTILAAGKLTAHTSGGWNIGVLDAVTEREQALVARSNTAPAFTAVEPRANYFVTRALKQTDRGTFGVMFTSVAREERPETSFLRSRAWAGGVDGSWHLGAARDVLVEWLASGTMVEGSAASIALTQRSSAHYAQRPDATHVRYDPSRTRLDGFGGRLLIARQSGLWRYHVQAQTYSPDYETNDSGFMQRADITATHAALIYSNPATTRWFRDRKFVLTKFQNWNYGGDLISNGLQSDNTVTFTHYMTGALYAGVTWKRLDDRSTRGGPLTIQPFRANVSWKLGSDKRKPFWIEVLQRNVWNTEGSADYGLSLSLAYKASRNLTLAMTPAYTNAKTWAQYVTSVADPAATDTYGRRYVFAELRQRMIDLASRVDWAPLPGVSVQAYVQPYVATGAYAGFKELARPRSLDYDRYDSTGTIVKDGMTYRIDPDGTGGAAPFTVANPDFKFRSLRANVVVRWEYHPGAAVYLVWNENRAQTLPDSIFDWSGDIGSLGEIPANRTVLVKASYRFEH